MARTTQHETPMAHHRGGKSTKAARIASTLAADIASGLFTPGSALDETEIAAHYGVSRTPVREAIRQLTARGMVETKAHRGAVVRAFDERELDDMFAVMADLEALCARGAALAMTAADRRDLRGSLAALTAAAKTGDINAYAAQNEQFHDIIYRGAHNGYLMQLTLDTRERLAPFRRAQFGSQGRLMRSLAEHCRVVEAIDNRDAVKAFDAMRAHIVVVRDAVDRAAPER